MIEEKYPTMHRIRSALEPDVRPSGKRTKPFGQQICGREIIEVVPHELYPVFTRPETVDIRIDGEIKFIHEIYLGMRFTVLHKRILKHTKEGACRRLHTKFLTHLAYKSNASGLAELDVSAREISGLAALRTAKEQFSVLYAHSTRNRLYSRKLVFVHRSGVPFVQDMISAAAIASGSPSACR